MKRSKKISLKEWGFTAATVIALLVIAYVLTWLGGFNRPPCDDVGLNAPCQITNP